MYLIKSFYLVASALLSYMFRDKHVSQYFIILFYIHVET